MGRYTSGIPEYLVKAADTETGLPRHFLNGDFSVQVIEDVRSNDFRAYGVPIGRLRLPAGYPVGHAVENTGSQVLLERCVLWRAIKFGSGELDKALQTTVHLQGARLLKDSHHPLVIRMGRSVKRGSQWIKINDQNMVGVTATKIVLGFRGHETGSPGIQTSPCPVDTQFGFPSDTDHDLMMFVAVLMRCAGEI